jgi:hypothetical protein
VEKREKEKKSGIGIEEQARIAQQRGKKVVGIR